MCTTTQIIVQRSLDEYLAPRTDHRQHFYRVPVAMYSSFETADEERQPLKGGVSNMLASKASHAFPRLIERNRDFFQSNSKVKIENKLNGHRHIFPWSLKYIINDNWFHLMLRWPTIYSLTALLLLWVLWLVFFAWMYVYVDGRNPLTECGLGRSGEPIKFLPALSFSLETCTTVVRYW